MNDEQMQGVDYISEKLQSLYPDQEGLFYGVKIPYMLGGNDPLDGVEIYESDKGIPHWHYDLLQPHVGTYVCKTLGLQFVVERSEIRDHDGNVVEVVE